MMQSPLESTPLFHLGPVPVTAAVASTWLIMLALSLGSWWLTRNLRLRQPGTAQMLAEWAFEALRAELRDTLRTEPTPYLPLIATVFLYILCANLSSLVPGNEPPTAKLETDAALALIVFVASIVFGVRARGGWNYLRGFAAPSIVMLPLNLLEQLTRSFSLMVRLFGNIMAGVFVIAIVLSLAGLLVPIPFMALDLLTGVVQAYIFAVLTMVFIGSSIQGEDEPADNATAPPSPSPDDHGKPQP
jgi:F-type H+-transporting ATPase subunit a